MQGLDYLCEPRDEPAMVSHQPKETLDLFMVVGVGYFLIVSILPSSVTIPWAEIMCPRYVISCGIACIWRA